MAIPVPQSSRTSSFGNSEMTLPLYVIVPVRVAVPGRRPIVARERTVLPEPDSPTTPRLSPLSNSMVTSLTARRFPRGVAKVTDIPSIFRSELISLTLSDQVLYERSLRTSYMK